MVDEEVMAEPENVLLDFLLEFSSYEIIFYVLFLFFIFLI